MSTVFLNGEYMAPEDAKISPMDRGFLFGDGIYEVIPSYDGKFVGFALHFERLLNGLAAIRLTNTFTEAEFREICTQLVSKNGKGNLGVYIQISRGPAPVRQHGFSDDITPTVFIYTFEIPPMPNVDAGNTKFYKVNTQVDTRWQNKHIKSTSLLGNVMHYQTSKDAGFDETLLFNTHGELTEAAACNVFIVSGNKILTPQLDHEKLPGITRAMVIDVVNKHSTFELEERVISFDEVINADEVWITSSSKQVAPVGLLNDQVVGDGKTYSVWYQVQSLFTKHLFDYN
ncbi:MAG: D-alanine transaminase [Psychrosphaera sp.]|jgi:D-alanine transaminase|uniref:aminotransferase class IV n=1 Tax=Psychrosphaera sp. F3M07 TaxID=2841560 RepID=UPI001C08314F|nr:aminotransferase class IV [Psychrosphaera sp. F3M07]MBU2916803.1 aminotransferase class IV [Psychrosphaera sp. F3M07]